MLFCNRVSFYYRAQTLISPDKEYMPLVSFSPPHISKTVLMHCMYRKYVLIGKKMSSMYDCSIKRSTSTPRGENFYKCGDLTCDINSIGATYSVGARKR